MKRETLLEVIALNERVKDETTGPHILQFFRQENFIFIREKSGNFVK